MTAIFHTWLRIGWQHSSKPIISHVEKWLSTTIDFSISNVGAWGNNIYHLANYITNSIMLSWITSPNLSWFFLKISTPYRFSKWISHHTPSLLDVWGIFNMTVSVMSDGKVVSNMTILPWHRDYIVNAPNQWEMPLHLSSLIGWAHTQNAPCLQTCIQGHPQQPNNS